MFDFEFDDSDLGSRRKPTEWVVVVPTPHETLKQQRCAEPVGIRVVFMLPTVK
jgi:hypothetical protein